MRISSLNQNVQNTSFKKLLPNAKRQLMKKVEESKLSVIQKNQVIRVLTEFKDSLENIRAVDVSWGKVQETNKQGLILVRSGSNTPLKDADQLMDAGPAGFCVKDGNIHVQYYPPYYRYNSALRTNPKLETLPMTSYFKDILRTCKQVSDKIYGSYTDNQEYQRLVNEFMK